MAFFQICSLIRDSIEPLFKADIEELVWTDGDLNHLFKGESLMTPVFFFGGSKRMTSLVFLSKVEKIHNKQTIIKIQLTSTGGKVWYFEETASEKWTSWSHCDPSTKSRDIDSFCGFLSRLWYWIQTPFQTVPNITPNGGRKLITQSMLVGGFNPSEKY